MSIVTVSSGMDDVLCLPSFGNTLIVRNVITIIVVFEVATVSEFKGLEEV